MLNLRVAFGASRTSHVFFNFVQKSMLNLRAASRLSNLALFSFRFTQFKKCSIFASLRAARTSHVYFIRSYRIIHSKNAPSSRHFVPLDSRTFFVSVYFASLMQRKYLVEFLELKKSQRLIFSTISFNASQARYAVLSIVSGVSVTYPSMIPWTSVPCSFRWTTSPQIQ